MIKFNLIFRKYILLWSFIAMLVGYLSGHFNPKRALSLSVLTEPLLFIMIFIMIIPTELSNILRLKSYLLPMGISFLLFLLSPFVAYVVSSAIPKSFHYLKTGIIIVSTAPPEAMLSAWAGFLEADILLTLIIQSYTFIAWIFLLPFGLSLFFKGAQYFSMNLLIKNLIILIVIPFAIAILIKSFLKNRLSKDIRKNIRITLSTVSGIIELFIILISIALNANIIASNPILILWGVLTAGVYYLVTFLISVFSAKVIRIEYEYSIPIIYQNATKNLPLAMVVALTSFKDQAILGVAACMLVQFPISAFFYTIITKIHKNPNYKITQI